jgi:hypothetical protein
MGDNQPNHDRKGVRHDSEAARPNARGGRQGAWALRAHGRELRPQPAEAAALARARCEGTRKRARQRTLIRPRRQDDALPPSQWRARAPPILSNACRAGLEWSRDDLARRAGLAERTITDFERGARDPHDNNNRAMRGAFEGAGLVFTARGCVCFPVASDQLSAENTADSPALRSKPAKGTRK